MFFFQELFLGMFKHMRTYPHTVRFVNIVENGEVVQYMYFLLFPSRHYIEKLVGCWHVHMEQHFHK